MISSILSVYPLDSDSWLSSHVTKDLHISDLALVWGRTCPSLNSERMPLCIELKVI